jgi:hypothetical protein
VVRHDRDELRGRLRHLPANYEYCIHKLARQIFPVCQRIAGCCGQTAPAREVEALWLELCMYTLRGLILSIARLAWHVLGFDPRVSKGGGAEGARMSARERHNDDG